MSDGTDATIGILEPGSPSKNVDNSLMTDGSYRQRVDAPTVADLLGNIEWLLTVLVGKTAQQNASGQVPSLLQSGSTTAVTGTLTGVTTVTTVTTCSTVSSLTNVVGIGGLAASYDQYAQINAGAWALRSGISVTA